MIRAVFIHTIDIAQTNVPTYTAASLGNKKLTVKIARWLRIELELAQFLDSDCFEKLGFVL